MAAGLQQRREGAWRIGNIRLGWEAAIAAIYALLFLIMTGAHGTFSRAPVWWARWGDQGQYARSAEAFLHGNLAASEHWYPLLYSLLLAPFAWMPPGFSALLTNVACFVVAFAGFRRVAAHLDVSARWAALLFLATTIAYPWIGKRWAEPWTTTLSAALIWLALAQAADALAKGRAVPPLAALRAGIVLGLIPLARPGDIVISAVIGLAAWIPWRGGAAGFRALGMVVLGGGAMIAAYGLLHLAIYGPHATGYMALSAAYGMDLGQIPWNAYLILVEPKPWFPDGMGLLAVCPWLVLGAAGLLMAFSVPERRALAACLGGAALAYLAMMLAFGDLWPSGLWRFNNVHYFKWLLPLFGLFAWIFLRELRSRPGLSGLALAIVLLPACLRVEPVPAAADAPARMVTFSGSSPDYSVPYFALSTVTDREGEMRNLLEYRQVPDERRPVVHALAVDRPFASGEQWWFLGRQEDWPPDVGMPNVEPLPGEWPRPALDRYTARVTFGYPCWLPPYPCPAALPAPEHHEAR